MFVTLFRGARVQNGISGSYMDAVFELVVHSQRFGQVYHIVFSRKAYYSSQVSKVSRVYVHSV